MPLTLPGGKLEHMAPETTAFMLLSLAPRISKQRNGCDYRDVETNAASFCLESLTYCMSHGSRCLKKTLAVVFERKTGISLLIFSFLESALRISESFDLKS